MGLGILPKVLAPLALFNAVVWAYPNRGDVLGQGLDPITPGHAPRHKWRRYTCGDPVVHVYLLIPVVGTLKATSGDVCIFASRSRVCCDVGGQHTSE